MAQTTPIVIQDEIESSPLNTNFNDAKSDREALEISVGTKSSVAYVDAGDNNLQSQVTNNTSTINTILVGQDLDPSKDVEVLASRVSDVYGTFPNLKDRLDAGDAQSQRSNMVGGGIMYNSSFSVNQENVSGVVVLASGEYGHDGFKGGSAGCTYTFSTVSNKTTLTISSGTLVQIIEARNFDNGIHVLSWEGSCQAQINGNGYGSSGLTNPMTATSVATIEFGAGTLARPKFEPGSIPTNFVTKRYSDNLRDCMFYYRTNKTQEYTSISSSGTGRYKVAFGTEMRVAPTIVLSNETPSPLVTSLITAEGFRVSIGVATAGANMAFDWIADARL